MSVQEQTIPSDAVAQIRADTRHPIIDADGHHVEILPLVVDCARDVAGEAAAERLARHFRTDAAAVRQVPAQRARSFWTIPTENTLDRVTAAVPALMYQRLDEIGIDFALMFPTRGLSVARIRDDEDRRLCARALNTYYARAFEPFRDRLEPVAVIPSFTPEEACAELDYAVGELGLKTVVMGGVVPRTIRPDGTPDAWIDTLGHGSLYDYDPVWEACVRHRVVPQFHANGYGWGSRVSLSNYVYNHVGNFASAQESTCRSLVMGGVPHRFPTLRFSFLEGGVAWAAQLYSDLLGHYEKRNAEAVRRYDPARLDLALVGELLDRHAGPMVSTRRQEWEASLADDQATHGRVDPATTDDWAESGIEGPEDIVDLFANRFFFGCEADDPMNALAFQRTLLPHGIRLHAMFASDIGHWDVPDIREVVPEAWELVEHGLLDHDDFADFTYRGVARMLTDVNPAFFDGTVVAGV